MWKEFRTVFVSPGCYKYDVEFDQNLSILEPGVKRSLLLARGCIFNHVFMFLNNLFNISIIPANMFYELNTLNLAKVFACKF